jgi:hypothetical protein
MDVIEANAFWVIEARWSAVGVWPVRAPFSLPS